MLLKYQPKKQNARFYLWSNIVFIVDIYFHFLFKLQENKSTDKISFFFTSAFEFKNMEN